MITPTKNPQSKTFQFVFVFIYKTSCITRGLQQLLSSIGWRIMVVQILQEKWCTRDWKRKHKQ